MANARALDKRRKSVRNIRKITRTMELIATARYRKAMDRASAATAYTERIIRIVSRLAASGTEVKHPLLEAREEQRAAALLVLTSNRGLCGGYNSSVMRVANPRLRELQESLERCRLEVSGKRGIGAFKFRNVDIADTYTEFEDQPAFSEVEKIAEHFLELYTTRQIDRLDVSYTRFISTSRQEAVVETLLPIGSLGQDDAGEDEGAGGTVSEYEFLPSAESVLEEVVPTSFKVKLFKCFLDAAVSEQVARMVAMKSATENAGEIIKQLSMTYNRARQAQITGEIMEIIGGVEALAK
jgi:F-type H+-transporting ATPase subunit gamma